MSHPTPMSHDVYEATANAGINHAIALVRKERADGLPDEVIFAGIFHAMLKADEDFAGKSDRAHGLATIAIMRLAAVEETQP